MANYSITWHSDTSADYKFYHTTNSIVIPDHKSEENPWRYPFADIFIYTYSKEHNIFTYRNRWKNLKTLGKEWGKIGFNASLGLWPNGTVLATFGYYEMRVSTDNRKYLEKAIGKNWHDVGLSPWYDHYRNRQLKTVAFELTPRCYAPAMPFY